MTSNQTSNHQSITIANIEESIENHLNGKNQQNRRNNTNLDVWAKNVDALRSSFSLIVGNVFKPIDFHAIAIEIVNSNNLDQVQIKSLLIQLTGRLERYKMIESLLKYVFIITFLILGIFIFVDKVEQVNNNVSDLINKTQQEKEEVLKIKNNLQKAIKSQKQDLFELKNKLIETEVELINLDKKLIEVEIERLKFTTGVLNANYYILIPPAASLLLLLPLFLSQYYANIKIQIAKIVLEILVTD